MMRRIWQCLAVATCALLLFSCIRAPLQPSLIESFLFTSIAASEHIQVRITPEPPPGTVVRYKLLGADRKAFLSRERSFQKCLDFFFPAEWHPYYLSLVLILPAGEASEEYLQVVTGQTIEVVRQIP